MNEIIPSFKESLFDYNLDSIIDVTELGIDSIIKSDFLRDFPFAKFIYGLGKTAQNIYNRNLLKQSLTFIQEFNKGTIKEENLIAYKSTINNNPKKCEQELSRILVLINSYVDTEKSKWLARIYKSYINKEIDWNTFCEYSEIINRLFIQDVVTLEKAYDEEINFNSDTFEKYRLDRLQSLGLVKIGYDGMLVTEDAPKEGINEYAKQFTKIILNK